jgi:hypothetical protein
MVFSRPTQAQFASIFVQGLKNEEFLKENKRITGFTLDFTPESLKKYDRYLSKAYKDITKPEFETLLGIGIYLGETVVKNIPGARWSTEPLKGPLELKIIIDNHQTKLKMENEELEIKEYMLYPIKSAANFFLDKTRKLYTLYQSLKDSLGEEIDINDEQWKHKKDYRFRVKTLKDKK